MMSFCGATLNGNCIIQSLEGWAGRIAKTETPGAIRTGGAFGILHGEDRFQVMSRNGRRFGMDQIQGDQTAAHCHPMEAEHSLQLIRQEALRRLRRAYEDAYSLGNLPMNVINRGIVDPNHPISRDEYIRRLMRDANVIGMFAEELKLVESHEHQNIRREFFARHPELHDVEWDPRKERPTLDSIAKSLGLSGPSELKEYVSRARSRRPRADDTLPTEDPNSLQ